MDSETIAASAGLITAAVGLITAIGTGIWKLISRADNRRESRESQMIAHLKQQLEKAEADKQRELQELRAEKNREIAELRDSKDREIHRLRSELHREHRRYALLERDARAWWGQLKENDIDPIPAEWTELMEDSHD